MLKESYKKESTKLLEEKIRLITEKSDDLRKNLFNKLSISTKNYEEIAGTLPNYKMVDSIYYIKM